MTKRQTAPDLDERDESEFVLNRSQEFNLEEEDLFLLREEGNPLLHVNTDNLSEVVKEYAVNPNLIERHREGASRGKQIGHH